MSESTLFVIREDGLATPCLYLRNSHASGPLIWTTLVDRYKVPVPPGELDAWENLWEKVADKSLVLKWWEFNALVWTYDNVVVRRADFELLSDSLKKFLANQPPSRVSHAPEITKALDGFLAEEHPPEAVCLRVTNLSENPWAVRSTNKDYEDEPYSIRTGTKHWFAELQSPTP